MRGSSSSNSATATSRPIATPRSSGPTISCYYRALHESFSATCARTRHGRIRAHDLLVSPEPQPAGPCDVLCGNVSRRPADRSLRHSLPGTQFLGETAQFRAVPPSGGRLDSAVIRCRLGGVVAAAVLDIKRFTLSAPKLLPPVSFDSRTEWDGSIVAGSSNAAACDGGVIPRQARLFRCARALESPWGQLNSPRKFYLRPRSSPCDFQPS